MGNIYSSASQVLVWIGDRGDRCYGETFLHAPSHGTPSRVFSGICSMMNNKWLAHNRRGDKVATYSLISENHPLPLHESKNYRTILGIDLATLSLILQFFSRRWFHRIWVIQEVVLASSAKVLFGKYEISWDWIGLAAAVIKFNFPGPRSELQCLSIPTGLMNAFLMYRISASQTCLAPLSLSFVQLLQLTQQFHSTEPHDRIFGLLGLKNYRLCAGKYHTKLQHRHFRPVW